jgi:Mg-chelatase subunit ChlI
MRTGIVGEVAASPNEVETVETVQALMRLFAQDACVVAGRYTQAQGRRVVTARDMRNALMYCARTFFEESESSLQTRVREEVETMQIEGDGEEESEGDGEEESEEESEEEGEEEGEEEEESEEEGEEGDQEGGEEGKDASLVKHVDTIVSAWSLWQPEDPIHSMLKRAIDATPVE